MSAFPCSACGQKRPGRMASLYWAWFLTDGARSAWRQKLCYHCATDRLGPLMVSLSRAEDAADAFACLACGGNCANDSDPVYLTLYLPQREVQEYSLQLDGACAAKLRIQAQEGAERLPDRGGEVRGPSPSTSAWDALGLAPR